MVAFKQDDRQVAVIDEAAAT